jgi:hypothetical protein
VREGRRGPHNGQAILGAAAPGQDSPRSRVMCGSGPPPIAAAAMQSRRAFVSGPTYRSGELYGVLIWFLVESSASRPARCI